jgi:tetratricopeptide (TPR) repeat protein
MRSRHTLAVACFLQLFYLPACKREPAPAVMQDVIDASPAAVISASAAASTVVATRAPATSYAEALKRGRESTLAQRYDDAIADFTTAIGFQDTAQAESERGYAQLLAGKLDDASQSLDEALDHGPSAELQAQIDFNVGLIEEKRGNTELARAAFARANATHPSSASKAKLAGQSQCPASVVRAAMTLGPRDASMAPYLLTTSWRDVYAYAAERGTSLLQTTHDWTIKPTSDAQARMLLVGEAGSAPWSIELGHLMFRDGFAYVLAGSSGRIVAVDGGMNGGGCTGMGARPAMGSSAALRGTLLEVSETVEWWNDESCKKGSGARTTATTTYYDPDASRMIAISAAASINGRTITIALPGCDPVAF